VVVLVYESLGTVRARVERVILFRVPFHPSYCVEMLFLWAVVARVWVWAVLHLHRNHPNKHYWDIFLDIPNVSPAAQKLVPIAVASVKILYIFFFCVRAIYG
jgi:hypothetical protein